jgi:hypothetical protein
MPPQLAELIWSGPVCRSVCGQEKARPVSDSGFPSLQCLVNDANQIIADAADYEHGWNSPE